MLSLQLGSPLIFMIVLRDTQKKREKLFNNWFMVSMFQFSYVFMREIAKHKRSVRVAQAAGTKHRSKVIVLPIQKVSLRSKVSFYKCLGYFLYW